MEIGLVAVERDKWEFPNPEQLLSDPKISLLSLKIDGSYFPNEQKSSSHQIAPLYVGNDYE